MNFNSQISAIAFCATSLLFPSSQANAACYEDKDNFKGVQYHWCGAWGTGGTMLGGLRGLDPIPYFTSANNGPDVWYIKLVSSQSDWSNIRAGDKLIFKIDDQIFEFTINSNSNRNIDTSDRTSGPQAVETVTIATDRSFFQRVGSAVNVEFALYTNRGRQERVLTPMMREHFTDLIKKIDDIKPNESK